MNALYFFVGGLACWRLASLLANEDGPFHIFKRFREWVILYVEMNPRGWLARFHFDEGLCCEWCNSIWVATALVLVLHWHWVAIFGLSTIAIFVKYIIQTLEQVREYYERLNISLKLYEGQTALFRNEVQK